MPDQAISSPQGSKQPRARHGSGPLWRNTVPTVRCFTTGRGEISPRGERARAVGKGRSNWALRGWLPSSCWGRGAVRSGHPRATPSTERQQAMGGVNHAPSGPRWLRPRGPSPGLDCSVNCNMYVAGCFLFQSLGAHTWSLGHSKAKLRGFARPAGEDAEDLWVSGFFSSLFCSPE